MNALPGNCYRPSRAARHPQQGHKFQLTNCLKLVDTFRGADLSVEQASAVIGKLKKEVGGEAAYVSLGGWLPSTFEEFRIAFDGDATLKRMGGMK